VVKTALIAGGRLWELIRAGADPADPQVIVACARTKLRIVARDERDEGVRQALNLGPHRRPRDRDRDRIRELPARRGRGVGLLAAAELSSRRAARRGRRAAAGRDLPTSLQGVDPDAVVMATARDKKRLGDGPVPFVLLPEPGAPRPGAPSPARADRRGSESWQARSMPEIRTRVEVMHGVNLDQLGRRDRSITGP